jgi:hypothetical protein
MDKNKTVILTLDVLSLKTFPSTLSAEDSAKGPKTSIYYLQ